METKKTDPNWVLDGMWLCWFHKQLVVVQLYLLQASLIGKSQSILDFPRKMGPYERNPVFPIYANTA